MEKQRKSQNRKKPESLRKSIKGGQDEALKRLAGSVGDFIKYWGFRRIHGEIWTVLFLANKPMSGVEVVRNLKVSKALVSPALTQLENYGLIKKVDSDDPREKRYAAESDYIRVIKTVLEKRELPMLEKIRGHFEKLKNESRKDEHAKQILNYERIIELENMTLQANFFLAALLGLNDFGDLQLLVNSLNQELQSSNHTE